MVASIRREIAAGLLAVACSRELPVSIPAGCKAANDTLWRSAMVNTGSPARLYVLSEETHCELLR